MIFIWGNIITLTGHGPISLHEPNQSKGLTALKQLPFAVMWHLKTQVISKLGLLCQDIANGKGFAVSNGSFKDNKGAAAWIIEGSSGSNRLQGTCLTPGAQDDQSAFQSELTRLYGILLTLSYLFPDKGPSIPLLTACDDQSALMQAKAMDPLSLSEPHYDLIFAIQNLASKMAFTI